MNNKALAALIPAYDKDGMNTTVAIYEDMSAENLHVSIRTAISRLFQEKLADEKGYRKWAKTIAKKKTGLALMIKDTKLVGIRCREVRSKGDGSMIYINRDLIYDTEDGYVYIKGLTRIPVLAKKRTIRDRIKDCDRISKAYDEKMQGWVQRCHPPFFMPWDDDYGYGNGNGFAPINLRCKNCTTRSIWNKIWNKIEKIDSLFQINGTFWNNGWVKRILVSKKNGNRIVKRVR